MGIPTSMTFSYRRDTNSLRSVKLPLYHPSTGSVHGVSRMCNVYEGMHVGNEFSPFESVVFLLNTIYSGKT